MTVYDYASRKGEIWMHKGTRIVCKKAITFTSATGSSRCKNCHTWLIMKDGKVVGKKDK